MAGKYTTKSATKKSRTILVRILRNPHQQMLPHPLQIQTQQRITKLLCTYKGMAGKHTPEET